MPESVQQLLIGVDGGGTGCRVAVGTPNAGIIAQAEGGPANVTSDPQAAIDNVTFTINSAVQKAGISPSALAGAIAHLGLAGVITPADSRKVASALPYGVVVVTDDRPTAVIGALGEEDGSLLSVGTGTIAAISADGAFEYVGGWGFRLSDQGSGAWLGRAVLEQVLLCHDSFAEHSDLTRTVFAKFGDDPNTIVAFSMAANPVDYAALAPAVVSAAQVGDIWGRALMIQGADHLVRSLRVLGFQPGDTLCLTGGVGPHYAQFLPAEFLTGRTEPLGTALDGAFHMAKSICPVNQRSGK